MPTVNGVAPLVEDIVESRIRPAISGESEAVGRLHRRIQHDGPARHQRADALDRGGLPIGVMLVGKMFGEETLIGLARNSSRRTLGPIGSRRSGERIAISWPLPVGWPPSTGTSEVTAGGAGISGRIHTAGLGVQADDEADYEAALAHRRRDHWGGRCLRCGWSAEQDTNGAVGPSPRQQTPLIWVELEGGAGAGDLPCEPVENHRIGTSASPSRASCCLRRPADGLAQVVGPAGGRGAPTHWSSRRGACRRPRGWGLAIQLYSVRSHRSWGLGDPRGSRGPRWAGAMNSAQTSSWSIRCTRPPS